MSANVDNLKKGRDMIFKWEGSEVGEVLSLSLSVDGESVDVSNWDSGDWNANIAGRKSWNMSVQVHYNEFASGSAHATLATAMIDGSQTGSIGFEPRTTTSGDVVYSGNVVLTNFGIDAGASDEPVEASFEMTGNGALTRSVTA